MVNLPLYLSIKKCLQTLFPTACVLCRLKSQTHLALCSYCIQTLPKNLNGCTLCGVPLTKDLITNICGDCLLSDWSFEKSIMPYLYIDHIREMIIQLKFSYQLRNAAILGTLFANVLKTSALATPLPEVILPVPLHAKRVQDRGFNQSVEIGKTIAKLTGIPIDWRYCQRIKNTKSQSGLSKTERKENIRHAFSISLLKQYTHVALFDDVFTTGNTVDALAKVLKKAGVLQVDVWCMARAVR